MSYKRWSKSTTELNTNRIILNAILYFASRELNLPKGILNYITFCTNNDNMYTIICIL